jgi:very-short-patch-repair endonuclease
MKKEIYLLILPPCGGGGSGAAGGGTLDLRKIARHLRKNMTPEEVKLWVNLKVLNKQGYNFRRQAPVDGYILDFVEFTQRLIIEVDGSQHGEAIGERKDKIRDAHFVAAGFQVLRFWNIDVNTEMDSVIHKILSVLKDPPPALRATSPARGEDK